MEFSNREFWTLIHGMVLGALFLLAFTGGLAGLYSLRPEWVTAEGIRERMTRLRYGIGLMALVAWATVLTGTWIVYPWYRENLSETDAGRYAGCEGVQVPTDTCSPRDFLLSGVSGDTSTWHTFWFEWKEHVAWMAPMFATAAAFLVFYYGRSLSQSAFLRRLVLWLFAGSFVTAGIAGLIGALVTKTAPIP
ncbi:MAG TPA: hypothetical protein VK926_09255 [Gaiellaceae bacterium]|nr:hypothetical protein [Gaiellaceae bacterium]